MAASVGDVKPFNHNGGLRSHSKPVAVKFCTINMNGMMTNHNKNKALLMYLEKQKIDIVFLQEINNYGGKTKNKNSKSVPQDKKFKSDFPNSNFYAYFSWRYKKKGGGTAILISKHLQATNVQKKDGKSKPYRIIIDMEISGIPCTIASYYGMQKSAVTKRTNLKELGNEMFTEKYRVYVIGGDFNTVMYNKEDYFYRGKNGKHNETEPSQTLRNLIQDNDMIDAFRNKHPKAKKYTRTDTPTGSKSRLDYIFVSQSVEKHFEATDVKIIKNTQNVIKEQTGLSFDGTFDHEMVMLSLQLGGPPIETDTVKKEIEYDSDEGIKPHGHSVTLNFKPGMDVQEIEQLLENSKLSKYLEKRYTIL